MARYKTWKLISVWKLSFCDYRTLQLTQYCIFFTTCVSSFVLPSVTRECHLEVLDLLDLLQCIVAYWHGTMTWFLERHDTWVFLALDFYSSLFARSWKRLKCMLEALDASIFHTAVADYSFHIDYEDAWRINTPILHSKFADITLQITEKEIQPAFFQAVTQSSFSRLCWHTTALSWFNCKSK